LNSFETHLGTDSALFQQLAECSASHGWLKDKLGTVEPTLDNLSASVKVMLDSGGNLVQQFGDFGNKLEQAQVPKGNPELERQLTEKFAENTQLQLGLQKVTTEIDSLKQLASKKDAKIENLQQSLASARRNFKDTEDRNQVLEIEKMALKGEMELMDQRIRHELATEHATFGNQMKVQYEERLHTLQAEKDELEKTAKVVMTQMHGVQDSLVGYAAAFITRQSLTASD
jgi:chromosome segregation ATPase